MISAVGELGYARVPVAEVIARAGVSRKAFYEHFANREACLLDASDRIGEAALELIASYASDDATDNGVEAALATLCARADMYPYAVRLALVEIVALGDVGIARRERLVGACERLLNELTGLVDTGAPNTILRAIVGGITGILCSRASALAYPEVAELAGWVGDYASVPDALTDEPVGGRAPAMSRGGRAPGTLAPGQGPGRRRGRRGSHGFIVHSQRERILDAVANLSATIGAASVTVGRIGEHAGVSLDTFYEHFASKEEAFRAAYEVGHSKGLAIVEGACLSSSNNTGVGAGVRALFDFIAGEPAFAHLALVDARTTGASSLHAYNGLDAYTQLFVRTLEQAGERAPSKLVLQALVGGILELCTIHVLTRRTWELPRRVQTATYFLLAPVLGARVATDAALRLSPI